MSRSITTADEEHKANVQGKAKKLGTFDGVCARIGTGCCRLVNEYMVLGLCADHPQCPVDSYVFAFWLYFGTEWDSGNIGYIRASYPLPIHRF